MTDHKDSDVCPICIPYFKQMEQLKKGFVQGDVEAMKYVDKCIQMSGLMHTHCRHKAFPMGLTAWMIALIINPVPGEATALVTKSVGNLGH